MCSKGVSCECQTRAGNTISGAVCGSDSDCHRLAQTSLRCEGGACEYLSPSAQWVAIAGTTCGNNAACATERATFECGGMNTCQLAAVWGGGSLTGSRCRYSSDCSGLAADLFRCQSNVCEFQATATAAWSSLGAPCEGGTAAECTAASVRGSLTCQSGWEGAYKALKLNGTCTFAQGKDQSKTAMNVTATSEMRGTACTANSQVQHRLESIAHTRVNLLCRRTVTITDYAALLQCVSMSSQYFRCASGLCEYHEWTPAGGAIWHQVPHLKYSNSHSQYTGGCTHDVQCQNLRSLLSCNITQGSCKVGSNCQL